MYGRCLTARCILASFLVLVGCSTYRPEQPPIAPVVPVADRDAMCREIESLAQASDSVRLLGRLVAEVRGEGMRTRILIESAGSERLKLDMLAPNAFIVLRTFLLSPTSIEERTTSGELVDVWSAEEDSLSRIVGLPLRFSEIVALVRGIVPASSSQCREGTLMRNDEGGVILVEANGRTWYQLAVQPIRLFELKRLDPFRGQLGLSCVLRWEGESLRNLSCRVPRRKAHVELSIQKYQRR